VKGPERLGSAIYSVRPRIIGGTLLQQPPVIVNDYNFMSDFVSHAFLPAPDSAGGMAMGGQAVVAISGPFAQIPISPFSYGIFPPEFHHNYPEVGDQASASSSAASMDRRRRTASGASDTSSDSSVMFILTHDQKQPMATGIWKGHQKIKEDESKWKAPGAERSANLDYEKQQLLAARAMRENVEEGLRTPNDYWSGMGFSRSMPSAVAAKQQDNLKVAECPNVEVDKEDNKIGPWPYEEPIVQPRAFNTTTYFDSGVPSIGDMDLKNVHDVPDILMQLHLVKYADIFREQEIDMPTFLTMNELDLKELGVNTFGARRKLLCVINELKERRRRGQ